MPAQSNTVTLPPESSEWDRELANVERGLIGLGARKCELQNLIKCAIGPNTEGRAVLPSGDFYEVTREHRDTFTIEAGQVWKFRRHSKQKGDE